MVITGASRAPRSGNRFGWRSMVSTLLLENGGESIGIPKMTAWALQGLYCSQSQSSWPSSTDDHCLDLGGDRHRSIMMRR